MRSVWLFCGVLLLIGTAQSIWRPLRLLSRGWVAVQEVRRGEFLLRPQCRLQASEKGGCNNVWLVAVRLWSWDLLSSAQVALNNMTPCLNVSCVVSPFQATRINLIDQNAYWVSDETRFVNGLLPDVVQFRLRPRRPASNCSFRVSSLFVQLYEDSLTSRTMRFTVLTEGEKEEVRGWKNISNVSLPTFSFCCVQYVNKDSSSYSCEFLMIIQYM